MISSRESKLLAMIIVLQIMINICWVNPDKYKIYISLEFQTWQIFYFYGYHIAICLEEVFIEISDSTTQVNRNFTYLTKFYFIISMIIPFVQRWWDLNWIIFNYWSIHFTQWHYFIYFNVLYRLLWKQNWGFNYVKC